ncbi:transposase [Bacilliculturomica massiliensis]|uniref:transposase n=2 Tax=Bacilliculturomica massiliensis TaxID=1917867 RepID=UPI001030231B|nr:transposase [Bacilliculturomica massiliensis]
MAYINGTSRDQIRLFVSWEDHIDPDNPVRLIDAFVDGLDLNKLGFTHAVPADTGRPAYDPAVLLKLYLYGYLNQIRSSRRLMIECRRNIELFYLLDSLAPDFRTIADFRKDNSEAIVGVFRHFVGECLSLGLYSKELLAVDGSKFRAVNGHKNMYNETILTTKLARVDNELAHYLKQLQEADEKEDTEPEKTAVLTETIEKLTARKERYEAYQAQLLESGETQLLTTDPQARMMNSKNGFHCCYNVQTAVDAKTHLVAAFEVTNHANDQQVLSAFSQKVKQDLKTEVLSVVADKGYDSQEEILACIQQGVLPYVGFRYDQSERLLVLPYEPQAITEERRRSTRPEDIRACLHAGVLPQCYEGSHLSVEVRAERAIGCFHRGLDKTTVTCPMGQTLRKTCEKHGGIEYACRPACRQCTNRCTPSRKHKVVRFGPGTEYVAARMYGEGKPVITQPPGFIPHNSFYRKNRPGLTVLLRVADDIPKQKLRLCVSEHPFGTVKWSHGAYYFLCKGIQKTSAEAGLSFLAYNMKRAINMKGVPALVEAMRGI